MGHFAAIRRATSERKHSPDLSHSPRTFSGVWYLKKENLSLGGALQSSSPIPSGCWKLVWHIVHGRPPRRRPPAILWPSHQADGPVLLELQPRHWSAPPPPRASVTSVGAGGPRAPHAFPYGGLPGARGSSGPPCLTEPQVDLRVLIPGVPARCASQKTGNRDFRFIQRKWETEMGSSREKEAHADLPCARRGDRGPASA